MLDELDGNGLRSAVLVADTGYGANTPPARDGGQGSYRICTGRCRGCGPDGVTGRSHVTF
ncbi:hypothetical protein ACLGI4_03040 [Streptomyces sp. HMX112]|uniref:hypothetical protein n=1 Tax=Streptomyces sp. HMX112 TaxID=3390850 RepID=UPI003A801C84